MDVVCYYQELLLVLSCQIHSCDLHIIIMFASTMYIGNVLDLHTHDLVTFSVIALTSDMTYSVT